MLLGAALFALIQAAAPAAPPQPQSMTKAAVQSDVKAGFGRMDTNKDGFVDKAEAQKGLDAEVAAAQKRRADRAAALLAQLDTNKDGSVSQTELQALLPAANRPAGNPYIDLNDANKDGRVTLSEVSTRIMANFDRLDRDKNGTVTPQERSAARSAQARPAGR